MAQGQWTEVEARAVLAAWRKSGQSVQAFAKERGIVPQRLRWWKSKIEGKSTAIARCCGGTSGTLLVDAYSGYDVVHRRRWTSSCRVPTAPTSLLPRGAVDVARRARSDLADRWPHSRGGQSPSSQLTQKRSSHCSSDPQSACDSQPRGSVGARQQRDEK